MFLGDMLCLTHKITDRLEAHRADVDAFNTLRLFYAILARQRTLEACAAQMKGL